MKRSKKKKNMNMLGKTIKCLRQSKGVTQEQLAEYLHISCQAVSKWENAAALPDITLLPLLAEYFDVSIDELFGYRRQSYTYKEHLIRLLHRCGALTFSENGLNYRIDTESISNSKQIAMIGGFFADFIRKNNLTFDALFGAAYHGITFSCAAACALHQKYGVITSYFHDRLVSDSHGRFLCGYTPRDGDKIIVIDDLLGTGKTLSSRLDRLLSLAKVEITAIIVIADTKACSEDGILSGSEWISKKYGTQVYSVITHDDIQSALKNGLLPSMQ